jgi:hypothetical protein
METTPCRDCSREVPVAARACPHCGALHPARRDWNGEGYEWKSQLTWMGSPLVHVAFGMDRAGRPRTARGVVAIGQRAVGFVAVGILAGGVVSFGLVSLGIFAGGVVSIGAVVACGVNAMAPVAIGVTAFGWLAGGLAPLGWKILFSTAP